MTKKTLSILHLEDNKQDAELVEAMLRRAGFECAIQRVESQAEFASAVAKGGIDLILSDYTLPSFDGKSALKIAREKAPEVPFVFLSGTIGEEAAIDSLLNGATDYVLKNRIQRLIPAVKRVLREADERRGRRLAEEELQEREERFRQLAENIRDVFWITSAETGEGIYTSPAYEQIWGRTRQSLYKNPKEWIDAIYPEDSQRAREKRKVSDGGTKAFEIEYRIVRPDGSIRWVHDRGFPVLNKEGHVYRIVGVAEDITERKKAEQKFREYLEATPDAIIIVNREGSIILANLQAEKLFGYPREELLGKKIEMLIPQRYRDKHLAQRNSYFTNPRVRPMGVGLELYGQRKDGTEFPVEISLSPSQTEDGTLALSAIRDITVRKEHEARIIRLNRVYSVLSGINSAIVRIRDRQELFDEACRIAVEDGEFRMAWIGLLDTEGSELTPAAKAGFDDGYILDKIRLIARDDVPDSCPLVTQALRENVPVVCNDIGVDPRMARWREKALRRGYHSAAMFPLQAGDKMVGVLALYSPETDFFDEDEMKLLTELASDISFALLYIEKEEKINYLAYYDAVTGLANRALCIDRLNEQLAAASIEASRTALVLVDIERFRTINDTLGRDAGDAFLKQIGERLSESFRGSTNLAHIGTHCFAAIMTDVRKQADIIEKIEQNVFRTLSQPFKIGTEELRISVKAGIAVPPHDGQDAETLLRNAEAALVRAIGSGESYLFYAPEMNSRVAEKLVLENKLRIALEKQQYVLHYQPKVNLSSGQVSGLEALIRWQDPQTGLVPPLKFIPLLEETGLILDVGYWVIRQALADLQRWAAKGVHLRIAVNVSPIQLRRKDFVDRVKQATVGYEADAQSLDVEITESLIMENIEDNIRKLKALREMGINVAIDDFGTGYSSLGYLAKLPVNALKIDRSFIVKMAQDPDSMTIVSTIISLAHSLKLKVIAEGVELEEQSKFLALLKCDEIQGYLLSKPLPVEAMDVFLAARGAAP